MIGIYKITNLINGKSYIGQSIHIKRRWNEHKKQNANSLIGKAIKKYGKKNFVFEVLEEVSKNDCELLDELEAMYIHSFNTITPNGYNIMDSSSANHTMFTRFDKNTFIDIVNDIQNTDLSFVEISKKYHLNRRTISRINNGYVHIMADLDYPLRKTKFDKQYNYCIDCGKEIDIYCTRCRECYYKYSKKEIPISKEELYELLCKNSFVYVGKMFGVSDNAIRKWCDKYNIPKSSSYYKNLIL